MGKNFEQKMDMIFKKVDVAQDLQGEGRFKDAVRLLAPEVKFVDALFEKGYLKEQDGDRLYSFETLYERMLYWFRKRLPKLTRQAPYNFGKLYFAFGSILIDLHNIEGAKAALEKALRWNPSSAYYVLEYAETFKMTGDLEKFYELSREAFKTAYLPAQVARCYRNLGYYFVERELWDVAIQCFSASLCFDRGEKSEKIVNSELNYIYSKTGEKIALGYDNLKTYAEQYGFPRGPDRDVVNFAYFQGKERFKDKEYDEAEYLISIAYDLVPFDEAKEMLDKIAALRPDGRKGMVN